MTTTLYVTADDAPLNERTRAMRGLCRALRGAASPSLAVVELRPDDKGGFVRRDGGAAVTMAPGDHLLVAASGWAAPGFIPSVTTARAQGAAVMLLVHDIARLRRPEWYDPHETAQFRLWLDAMLGLAAQVLVPSNATAKDLAAYRRETSLPAAESRKIRLGDGMLDTDGPQIRCPIEGRFALLAAPIEIRINHAVLVEAWRRLGARMPASVLPSLVFAGPIGPLTQDLRVRLARGTDARIHTLLDPDDATLAALYRSCTFSIFPALYEGWGLTVTESLAFGKPVFAANAMGLPEAGGRLARYFDPLDPDDTARHIERVLNDDGDLRRWQDEIARDFRRVAWADTAAQVIATLA